MLDADVFRQFAAVDPSLFAKLYLRDRGFRPIVTMRIFQHTRNTPLGRLVYPLLWLLHRRVTRRAGMELNLRTKVGPGLLIAHSVGIVINEGAEIGRNVTLFHGVTLGRSDRIGPDGKRSEGKCPVIEDDVWLGPHAVIVGGVRIGRGSRILANSFVTEDIPENCMVSGNPARIIRENCPPDITNKYPPDP